MTWVGFDRERAIGLTGAAAALPLWVRFRIEQMRGRAAENFEPPPGIVFRKICQDSGLLSRYNCSHVVEEAFEEGRTPTEECGQHRDRILDFFHKKEE